MKLSLQDETSSIKENYLQALALLYLPCETFSPRDTDEKSLAVEVKRKEDSVWVSVFFKVFEQNAAAICEKSCDSAYSERMLVKLAVGEAFLDAAEKLFSYRPPWGIVTGIRPAKLAADYLTRYDENEVKRILCEDYFVYPERAKLCIRTAKNEKRLVAPLKENTFSLYVSIPFCPSKCRYCSFVSATTPRLLALIPDYLEALLKELSDIAETAKSLGLTLSSVYVGGGTPAVLSAEQIKRLVSHIHTLFALDGVEFTFEAGRPDVITADKLRALKEGQVTRISINTQTANDTVLACVGRKHSFADYLSCMDMARDIGLDCINTDLIAGLPGETTESFCESLQRVCAVRPENVTVHAFTLKRSSEYKMENTAEVDSSSRAASRMLSFANASLTSAGFEPYYMYRQKNTVGNLDNTGFALPGTECLYNIYMMGEYHTVLSAGAGAVTKYVSRDRERIERAFCVKYPYEYLDPQKYAGFDRAYAEHFYSTIY